MWLNNTGPGFLNRLLAAWSGLGSYRELGLEVCCDRDTLENDPALEGIREGLFLIHHHNNSWNLQHDPPPEPDGYRLLLGHDIQGFDIEYCEYGPGDHEKIVRLCDRNPDAIAFNFNGYIKGRGGRPMASDGGGWMRSGGRPWICVDKDYLQELGFSSSGSS